MWRKGFDKYPLSSYRFALIRFASHLVLRCTYVHWIFSGIKLPVTIVCIAYIFTSFFQFDLKSVVQNKIQKFSIYISILFQFHLFLFRAFPCLFLFFHIPSRLSSLIIQAFHIGWWWYYIQRISLGITGRETGIEYL